MELDVLELVNFDTFILENTEAADSLAQLLLLQFAGWPSHHMDVDPRWAARTRCSIMTESW